MKTLTLYSSQKHTSADHYPVVADGLIVCWIRATVSHELGVVQALDKAKPRAGETVLNTIEVSDDYSWRRDTSPPVAAEAQ